MTQSDIEKAVRLLAQYVQYENQSTKAHISDIRKMIQKKEAENRKQPVVSDERLAKIDAALKKTEREVEDEETARISIEKNMQDIRAAKNSIEQSVLNYKKKADLDAIAMKNDMRDIRLYVHGIENRVESSALKMLTAQLQSFATVTDRKLAEIVTKEDHRRAIVNIEQKIAAIETPDISRLEQRVLYLENKLDDIHEILTTLRSRIPLVVE